MHFDAGSTDFVVSLNPHILTSRRAPTYVDGHALGIQGMTFGGISHAAGLLCANLSNVDLVLLVEDSPDGLNYTNKETITVVGNGVTQGSIESEQPYIRFRLQAVNGEGIRVHLLQFDPNDVPTV